MKTPNSNCKHCKKPFYARPAHKSKGRGQFCSRACYCSSNGYPPPLLFPEVKRCLFCNKEIEVLSNRDRKRKFCGSSCAASSNNVRWRKGLKYCKSSTFKDLLLKYHKPVCMIEGCGYDKFVDAHHIIPRKEKGGSTLKNGILLCPNHHREADHKLIDRKHLFCLVERSFVGKKIMEGDRMDEEPLSKSGACRKTV